MDILADVLAVAGKGARKTRIMQEANLSHELLKKYLGEAVSNAFLKSSGFAFELTEKGQKFLEEYKQLYEEYSKVGNSFKRLMSEWEALERTCQNRSDNNPRTDNSRGKKDSEKRILRP